MRIENGAGSKPEQTPRPDLQAVLRHYGVHVEHSGVHLCVVHDETRPSMSVDLDKQVVKCHSCGFGGDAYSIIQEKEQVDFRRAADTATQFESATPERGGDELPSILGRRRPGIPRQKGDSRSRRWSRPW